MPTDPSTAPATATTRRAFLARTAVGGALATAVLAGPLRDLLPTAGAQGAADVLDDATFGTLTAPVELAAVQAYQAALDADVVDATWSGHLATFQAHHRTVAGALEGLRGSSAPTPSVPDPALVDTYTGQIEAAADQAALLGVLSGLEDAISATHLAALSSIPDPVTAKTVAQVLAIEAQTAAFLGTGAGLDLAELTPAESSTEAALDLEAAATTTTTTTAAADDSGDATTTTEASDEDSTTTTEAN